MGKYNKEENPTIRVLLLGAANVGKSAIESRFTTGKYPPEFDTCLTLSSRKCVTLSCTPCWRGITQRIDLTERTTRVSLQSTGSLMESDSETAAPVTNTAPTTPKISLYPRISSQLSPLGPPLFDDAICCADCERERRNNTFMVEIINYPRVQSPTERSKILLKRDFDAVLLIYDIGNRESFESIAYLHNEIILDARQDSFRYSISRMVGWKSAFKRKKDGEIVVGVVGNKCDIDPTEGASPGKSTPRMRKNPARLGLRQTESLTKLFGRSKFFENRTRIEKTLSSSSTASLASGCSDSESVWGALTESTRSTVSNSGDEHADDAPPPVPLHKSPKLIGPRLPRKPLNMKPSKSFKVDSWVKSGSPITETMLEEPDRELAETSDMDVPKTGGSTSGGGAQTSTSRGSQSSISMATRQVTKQEGEVVTRSLLLPVPFFETSAKTGENVDDLFESVVREVLKQIGRNI